MKQPAGILQDFLKKFKKLSTNTKVLLLSAVAICVIVIAAGFIYTQKEEYDVLFSNLSSSDANEVTTKLEELKTKYKIKEEKDGTITVSVPENQTAVSRMEVSATFQPTDSVVGYEILDNVSFGETQSDRNQKRLRAIEGEITKTLEKLASINWARVHINTPQSNFLDTNEEPSSASVTLQLKEDQSLSKNQVLGIIKMISNSVEGLKPENVEVIDDNANLLSDKVFNKNSNQDSNEIIKLEQQKEQNVKDKIDRLLTVVVGKGNATTEVDLDVNFDQKEIAEQKLGDKVALAEKEIEKNTVIGEPSQDAPGADTNSDEGYKGNETTNGNSNKESYTETQTNYEIEKRNEKTIVAPGDIKKMTISVVINKNALQNEDGTVDESLKDELENNIKNAAGFNEVREDSISVTLADFNNFDDEQEKLLKKNEDRNILISKAISGVVAIATIGGVVFLIKKSFDSVKAYIAQKKEDEDTIEDVTPLTIKNTEIDGITSIEDSILIEERLNKTIDSNTKDVVKALRFVMNDNTNNRKS